jgi:hypothetical protein
MNRDEQPIVDEERALRQVVERLMGMPLELLAYQVLRWLREGSTQADAQLVAVLDDYGIDAAEYRRPNHPWLR